MYIYVMILIHKSDVLTRDPQWIKNKTERLYTKTTLQRHTEHKEF